jgi:hypothetical protein
MDILHIVLGVAALIAAGVCGAILAGWLVLCAVQRSIAKGLGW